MRIVLATADSYHNWRIRAASKFAGFLYVTGIVSGTGAQSSRDFYQITIRVGFHPRPYVLWRMRHYWFHSIRYGHGYYDPHLGFCGKCAPWPCCDAVGPDHELGCVELRRNS